MTKRLFVEQFLQPLEEGEPPLAIRFDENRGLNVLPDGRALVDVELEGGTVTGTKAGGEQDDADRDPQPTTVTMVQAEGFDYGAHAAAVQAGTVTLTEVSGEATDADEDQDYSESPSFAARSGRSPNPPLGWLGTMTHTAVEAESSDID